MKQITRENVCYSDSKNGKAATIYCECQEETYTDGFPTIVLGLGGFTFFFEAEFYILWDAM